MKILTSVQNPLVKEITLLKESAKERAKQNLLILEGKKILREVTRCRPAKMLFLTDTKEQNGYVAEEVIEVSDQVMKKISDCKAPEGALALFETPKETLLTQDRILVLDRISDPGNMGTLWRTAFALNFDGIYLLEGCCDPFSPKALRSAKGATFHLPYTKSSEEQFLKWSENRTRITASMEGVDAKKIEGPLCLILGSEHSGVSKKIKELSNLVSIPMREGAESLNVAIAGGILMKNL